ncbi:MAG: hypothetical protein BWX97_00390 [Firmicutes bacterium ADurb.Bin146]|nr:MAG: hypothetical protein BWX97_00390 [Firmicutes bacterium ADurb.Bin146]
MDSLEELSKMIDIFVKERDWDKYHSPVNLAKSISIEANELLECFQWSETDFSLDDVKKELADVINYCIQMATKLDLNIKDIVLEKLDESAKKYPVDKAKGTSTKYDKL